MENNVNVNESEQAKKLGLTEEELKRYQSIATELKLSLNKLELTQKALSDVKDSQVPQVKELRDIINDTKKVTKDILQENNKVTQLQIQSMMESFKTIDQLLKDNMEALKRRLNQESRELLPNKVTPYIAPKAKNSVKDKSTPFFDPKMVAAVDKSMPMTSAILDGIFPGLGALMDTLPGVGKSFGYAEKLLAKGTSSLIKAPGKLAKKLFSKDSSENVEAEKVQEINNVEEASKEASRSKKAKAETEKNKIKKANEKEKKERDKRHKEVVGILKSIEKKISSSDDGLLGGVGGVITTVKDAAKGILSAGAGLLGLGTAASALKGKFGGLGKKLGLLRKGYDAVHGVMRGFEAYKNFKSGDLLDGTKNAIQAGLHGISLIPGLGWAGIAGEFAEQIGGKVGEYISDFIWNSGADKRRKQEIKTYGRKISESSSDLDRRKTADAISKQSGIPVEELLDAAAESDRMNLIYQGKMPEPVNPLDPAQMAKSLQETIKRHRTVDEIERDTYIENVLGHYESITNEVQPAQSSKTELEEFKLDALHESNSLQGSQNSLLSVPTSESLKSTETLIKEMNTKLSNLQINVGQPASQQPLDVGLIALNTGAI